MSPSHEPFSERIEGAGDHPVGRRAVHEASVATTRGGILYDASLLRNPVDALFEREHWAARGALTELVGGRGSVAVLHAAEKDWVLRHYRRGGWAAKISSDRYVWHGPARARSYAEWRLLAELHRRGLPVPRPIAARYVRGRLTYRADLITERLAGMRTLAELIVADALEPARWRTVGRTIAAFHREGVRHADLNANNILCGDGSAGPPVALLDFDRGRIRARGAWEGRVLARLRRSLKKIQRRQPAVSFTDEDWRALMEGYEQALAAPTGRSGSSPDSPPSGP